MLRNKSPLRINDPAHDERFRGARLDARSILCVPLLVRSRLIGVLTVYNKKAPKGFTEDDERLLTIMGAQSAQVVEKARLYQEKQALLRVREEVRPRDSDGPAARGAARGAGYRIAGASRPAKRRRRLLRPIRP